MLKERQYVIAGNNTRGNKVVEGCHGRVLFRDKENGEDTLDADVSTPNAFGGASNLT